MCENAVMQQVRYGLSAASDHHRGFDDAFPGTVFPLPQICSNPDCNIIVTGWQLRRSDGGLVGNLAVIGCSSLDREGDLLDFDIQEVTVSQTILRQSRKTFLVADHTKFARSAPARIASLADIDVFFTDRALPADLSSACKAWGTEVVEADWGKLRA